MPWGKSSSTQRAKRSATAQHRLYADERFALLLILQALDAGGKDGTIRHVFARRESRGLARCVVQAADALELAHDFLWRTTLASAARAAASRYSTAATTKRCSSSACIRNCSRRSTYRITPSAELWEERFRSIVEHERHLASQGTVILKFWLNISKDEQRQRLLSGSTNREALEVSRSATSTSASVGATTCTPTSSACVRRRGHGRRGTPFRQTERLRALAVASLSTPRLGNSPSTFRQPTKANCRISRKPPSAWLRTSRCGPRIRRDCQLRHYPHSAQPSKIVFQPWSRRCADEHSHLDLLGHGIDSDFTRSLLQSIALFRGVEPDTIADLLPRCGRLDVAEGDLLLSPDRPNHCVYIVLAGRLAVRLGALDAPKIADLAPGACAGEMSLIEDKDPSAYVIATEESHLMVISHNLLWQMVDRSHAFSKNLLIVLSERVRSDNEFIASRLGVLRQAERNALTDALTGLGNRHWMKDMFEREVTRAQHSGKTLCLMMIDVDNFKQFNDRYGHIAGDRVLIAVAGALREYLRPTDLIARFGGDEFAVLLPDVDPQQAAQTAERVREQIAALSPPSLSTAVTVSIGVTARIGDDDVNRLVHRADEAMYEAKAQGRNRVAISVSR